MYGMDDKKKVLEGKMKRKVFKNKRSSNYFWTGIFFSTIAILTEYMSIGDSIAGVSVGITLLTLWIIEEGYEE